MIYVYFFFFQKQIKNQISLSLSLSGLRGDRTHSTRVGTVYFPGSCMYLVYLIIVHTRTDGRTKIKRVRERDLIFDFFIIDIFVLIDDSSRETLTVEKIQR
jgi:hypothetical protein